MPYGYAMGEANGSVRAWAQGLRRWAAVWDLREMAKEQGSRVAGRGDELILSGRRESETMRMMAALVQADLSDEADALRFKANSIFGRLGEVEELWRGWA